MPALLRCRECREPFHPVRPSGKTQQFCTPACRIRAASKRNHRRRQQRRGTPAVASPAPPRGATHGRVIVPELRPGDGQTWRAYGRDAEYLRALRASAGRWI